MAKYDGDQNGWIDEKDAAYKNLSIWTKAADGTDIFTDLKAVGARGFEPPGHSDFSRKDGLPRESFIHSVINKFSRSSRLIPSRYLPLSIMS
ncbi:MAG: hypothetical protein C0390_02925 [Syntrophus sp. (in: bacteria)]|nr:hypothetical protein [Syntrophus sp. (in: bacteria)]